MGETLYTIRLTKQDVEMGLKVYMDELAAKRQLTAEIKLGLTLVAQLRQGNNELLNKEFPNACTSKPTPPPTTPLPGIDISQDIHEIKVLLETRLPADGGQQSAALSSVATGGPKAIAAPQFAIPEPDADDGDTIVLNKATGGGNIRGMMDRVTDMMRVEH